MLAACAAARAPDEAPPTGLVLTTTAPPSSPATTGPTTSTHPPVTATVPLSTYTPTHLPTPTPTPTNSHTPTPPPTLTLLFTGDINPGRCPAQIALTHSDFTLPYQIVGDALRAADITIGSLDGSISDLSRPSPCPQTMNLIGPSRTVEGLLYAGFDVITVATNHALDCGSRGWDCDHAALRDTLAHLDAAGIAATGGGEDLSAARQPAIIERQGVRFAFLGVTQVGAETWAAADRPGTAPLSEATLPDLLDDIAAARAVADVVIVLPQWGIEYSEQPATQQREWARAMAAAGATLVIGNHPHMVQPVEVFAAEGGTEAVAAYALGNFVFDQGPWRTRQGAVFEATFEGARLVGWRLLPIHIKSLHQPHWADAAEAAAILARMPTLTAP